MTEQMTYSAFRKHFYFARLGAEELLIMLVLGEKEFLPIREIRKLVKSFLKKSNIENQFEITLHNRNTFRVIDRMRKMSLMEKNEKNTIFVEYRLTPIGSEFKKWASKWRGIALNEENWEKTRKVGNVTKRVVKALEGEGE